MDFLFWLQQTSLARYVQESPWGYPIVLSAHAVGMALLAGIVLMINFRMLGFARTLPLKYLQRLMGIALFGLLLNVASGLALFVADAADHAANVAFLLKIALLIVAGVLLMVSARRTSASGADVALLETNATRVLAGLSIAAWVGVILAGRLIAYVE